MSSIKLRLGYIIADVFMHIFGGPPKFNFDDDDDDNIKGNILYSYIKSEINML